MSLRLLAQEWVEAAAALDETSAAKENAGRPEEALYYLGQAYQLRSCAAQLEFVEAMKAIEKKQRKEPA